jgi:hypothetical protein
MVSMEIHNYLYIFTYMNIPQKMKKLTHVLHSHIGCQLISMFLNACALQLAGGA